MNIQIIFDMFSRFSNTLLHKYKPLNEFSINKDII